MIFERAKTDPQGLAIEDGSCQRSWAELSDRTIRIAHFLRDQAGLVPGDHVALLMDNRAEVVELLHGAILAGLWVTPINWHLTEEEVAYVIEDSGARIVFSDERFGDTAERAVSPLAPGRSVSVLRAGPDLDAVLASASDAPFGSDEPAGGNMIYTSGTTGRPKGVKRASLPSVGAALSHWRKYGRRVGLDGTGLHLVTGPMYHAAPLMFAIYDQSNGAPMLIMPRWEERQALEMIEEREVAHTHLVPTMFVRLLRLPEEERARFEAPRLDLVLHGAAPVSMATKRKMIDWWGPVFTEYWGGTEGGVNTLVDSEEWLQHEGTVGRAQPGFEVFAVDSDRKRLPANETGDLYCRTAAQPRPFEYHGDPEKTEDSYLEPGVFTIGDIGYVDDEGYVFLADRRSHTIISGGVNIYPAEIEAALLEHPAVADVAVFGIPDEEWGESVKAAIELASGVPGSEALAAEILDFARGHLAGYKVPRSIDFEVKLPRHPTGKLLVRQLREPYWKGRDRRI